MNHRQAKRVSWFAYGAILGALLAPVTGSAEPAKRISGNQAGNCFNPSISPDGKQLAYEVNYFDRRTIELYIHDLTASTERQVKPLKSSSMDLGSFGVSSGGDQVSYELAWSPAKLRRYLFSSSGADKNFDIYDARGGILAAHPAADGQPAWSDDGRFIVFTSARTGEGDLYLLDTSNPSALTQLTSFSDGPEWYPTWAPGSTRLAFVRHTPTAGDHIYIMADPAKPKELTQLTNWSSIQTKPSWSPDGTRLAFYANQEDKERYDLYVIDAKPGAKPTRLLTGVVPNERRGPAWTPDGKAILQVQENSEAFNPILVVSATVPGKTRPLATGTQNNGDVSVTQVEGGPAQVTFVAQGRLGDSTKDFKRVFIYGLQSADLDLP